MDKFIKPLDKAVSATLILLVVAMVFCVTAEILMREVAQPLVQRAIDNAGAESKNLKGIQNFISKMTAPVSTASQTLLVWVGILGASLALRQRAHLGIDALTRIYPRKVQLALDYLSTALLALFSLFVMTVGGAMVCRDFFENGTQMPGLDAFNKGWFYSVLVIAGALNLIYCFYHFLHPQTSAEESV